MSEYTTQTRSGIGTTLMEHRARAHKEGHWSYTHAVDMRPPADRNRYLVEELVPGRRVLHIGCASEGEAREQFERGQLLFALIESAAAAQLGIDPDQTGMSELESIVKPSWPLQVCCLEDTPDHVLDAFRPDLLLLGEVVEHVPDAGTMLRAARDVARRFGAEIVVTVPSALSIDAITAWLEGVEAVHPDHVAAYTPRTLQTLFEKCDLQPVEIRPYTWGNPPRPISMIEGLKLLVRTKGDLQRRLVHVAREALAYRFPSGWIGRARAA